MLSKFLRVFCILFVCTALLLPSISYANNNPPRHHQDEHGRDRHDGHGRPNDHRHDKRPPQHGHDGARPPRHDNKGHNAPLPHHAPAPKPPHEEGRRHS